MGEVMVKIWKNKNTKEVVKWQTKKVSIKLSLSQNTHAVSLIP
jgi:hypothetical protein